MLEAPPGTRVIFALMGLEPLFESRGKHEVVPLSLATAKRLEVRASNRRGTAHVGDKERTRKVGERQVVRYH